MPNCRDCSEPINFARLGDRTIPVDATPDCHEGSFVLYREFGVLKCRPARLPQDYSRSRHRHHFDTCKSRRYGRNPQR
ncbi:MAG TPA: hypothetical protein VN752_05620 [Solirubrobacterales bacterium]|nr:hypothetical protein [Solirubrobacterales bacterium]